MNHYDNDDDDKALQEFLAKKKATMGTPSNFNHQSSRNVFASLNSTTLLTKTTSPKKDKIIVQHDDDDDKALQEFLAQKKNGMSTAFNTQSSRNIMTGVNMSRQTVDSLTTSVKIETKENDDEEVISEFMKKKQSMYEGASRNTASSR